MLSEVSQTAKNKYCVFSYMWNLKEPTTQKQSGMVVVGKW